MPNVNDIVTIAEALEKSPVVVVKDRCVAVRNRNASCGKCVDACAHGVIAVTGNVISFDTASCVGCGACTTACPTEALVFASPSDADLARSAALATTENDGVAVFACARISSKRLADPDRYAEVPCLARMEESLMLSLAAHGAFAVLLVDGACSTCKHRDCAAGVDAVVDNANVLLAAQGSAVRVARASAFPEGMLVEDARGRFGSTRRGFFSDAAAAARETAMTAARTTIESELGYAKQEASIGERLRVDSEGVLPRIAMRRHEVIINSMDALGAPVVREVRTRSFGTIDIDLGKCNACGMCAVFCPSGAIVRDKESGRSLAPKYLEFSAADCVQCGLCADSCWKGALTLSDVVTTEEIFDFEPRTFVMPEPRKSSFAR